MKLKATLSIILCACLLSGCNIFNNSEFTSSTSISDSESSSAAASNIEPNSEADSPSTTSSLVSASSANSNESNNDSELPAAPLTTEEWEKQAVILTEQIVDRCLQTFDENIGITSLNSREIFNFICTISKYDKLPLYPYRTFMTITEPSSQNPNLVAHISEKDAQIIAYQLFGVTDWFYDAPDCYNAAIPEYYFNLEAGLPTSPYSSQEATAKMTGDSIVVSFRLTDSDQFAYAAANQPKDFGEFYIIYKIVSEGNQTFLRFGGLSSSVMTLTQ